MKHLLVLLTLGLLPLPSLCGELAPPEAPVDLEMFWVAKYMEFNDIPMSIRSFKTPERLSSLTPRLAEYLRGIGEKVQISQDREGWTVLATADDHAFYSIRLNPLPARTEGVFTVSAKEPSGEEDTPLPLGFFRVEKQKFFDGPSIQEFTVLGTGAGQSEALAVVERMMRQRGWSTTRNYRSTRYFSRRNEQAHAIARPGENGIGTLVLINKELSK